MPLPHVGVLGVEENGVLGIKNHICFIAWDNSRVIKKKSCPKLRISFLLKEMSLSLAMTNRRERASIASLAYCNRS